MFCSLILFLLIFDLINLSEQQFSMRLNRRKKEEDEKPTSFLKQMDVFGEKVSSRFDNVLYEGMITVGTPPKPFRVILDTGSAILWLPKKGCENHGRMGEYCKKGVGTYNPDDSDSAHALNKDFEIRYGIGETTGKYYSDVFAFGDLKCKKQLKFKHPVIFGAGDDITDGDQGILGLGFKRDDEIGTSIFDQAVNEGLMTKPMFTVVYQKCPNDKPECEGAGMITLGAFDTKRCGKELGTVKLTRFALQWEFQLEQISVAAYTKKLKNDFITDSGASHLFLPYDVVDDLIEAIGAKEEDGDYIISCKRKWQINFKINGTDYAVKSPELVLNLGNDKCQIAIRPKPREPFVLGGPFLRSFCNIHYWKEKKLGFARIK